MYLFYGTVALIIVGSIILTVIGHTNTNTYTAYVIEKEVKNEKNSSKYLIFTELENGERKVFQNTDSWLRFKFDSSDYYSEIQQGESYQFDVYGFRIPFLSRYENIIGIEKVSK